VPSVTDLLLPALAGRFGDRSDAVTVAERAVSWERLATVAGATAVAVQGERMVAVEATPTLDTVVSIVACLAAGVPVVPVPPDVGAVEREHIMRDSGAVPMPAIAWEATAAPSLPEPPPTATALVLYTSGTTGAPKGVVLSRGALAAGLDGLADAWAWTSDDVLVHGLPLFHVHGLVLGVLGALRVGSGLVHTGRPTPDAYAAAAAAGGTMFFGVPTVWSRLCDQPTAAAQLSSARLVVSGSAPLPVPVFERMRALIGSSPVERYGMTETLITLSTRVDGERRAGWVGVPVGGTITRLVDDDGGPVDADGRSIGSLQVMGPSLFDGYLGRAGATADSFDGEWFLTGDAAVLDGEGYHRIVGRQSMDIIKSGGFKVGAGEVETALLGHPAVAEVAVVGVPDDDLGERIVAVVVPAAPVEPAVLVQHVADSLSVHKRPREVRLVESLPRNAMGKVQKHLLR
jgi:fatty acid CoA ligase FadD36